MTESGASMSNVDVEAKMASENDWPNSTKWTYAYIAFLGCLVLGYGSMIVGKNLAPASLQEGFYVVGIYGLMASVLAGLLCIAGYYAVARSLPEGRWKPSWPLYILGHIFLAPIAALVFLVRLYKHDLTPF